MMSTDLDSIFSPHFSRLSSSFFRPRTSLSSFQVAQARRQGEGFEGVRSEPPFGLQKDFKHHLELCILISVHRLIKSGPLASMLCLSGPSGRPATELMRHSCPNKSLSIYLSIYLLRCPNGSGCSYLFMGISAEHARVSGLRCCNERMNRYFRPRPPEFTSCSSSKSPPELLC